MKVWKYEIKKAFHSPIVYVLIILFLTLNFWVIYRHAEIRGELKVTNELVEKFGYHLNDNVIVKLKSLYQSNLEKVNELTRKKLGRRYNRAQDVLADIEKHHHVFSKKELNIITETALIEIYYELAQTIDEKYENLNLLEKAKLDVKLFRLSGKAAKLAMEHNEKLNERLNELVNEEEHKTLFFNGYIHSMHTLLFKKLLKKVVYEVMILVVLITGYIASFEFESRTHFVTFTSKRGRMLLLDKLYASLIATLIVCVLVLVPTLIVYFLTFDYSGLWGVPISSFFNGETPLSQSQWFPYISWWNMSFGVYLISVIFIFFICQLLFAALTYSISILVKNSYFTYTIFGTMFGLFLFIPMIVPHSSTAIYWTRYTPFSISLTPHIWFMGWNVFFQKAYELVTVVIWTVLLFVTVISVIYKFNKESLN